MNDDELTPSEQKAMEALPRERVPSADLEDRVVDALRERGVLLARKSRVVELSSGRIAGVVAACLVLVAGGFTLGFWGNSLRTAQNGTDGYPPGGMSVAATLQHAGTVYLAALEELAALPDSTHGEEMLQGREVALRTLYTATDQVTKIVPKSYLAGQLLHVIQTSEGIGSHDEIPARQAIWF
jgi:hypothetical protein